MIVKTAVITSAVACGVRPSGLEYPSERLLARHNI
jgi:hypothetical protein